MAAIHIRDIPDEFLVGLKVTAAKQSKSLKEFVMDTLQRAMDDQNEIERAKLIQSRGIKVGR